MNLVLAWLWIAVGIVVGFVLGAYFHRDDWLGGYTSFKRRLYRLAHISFFGLAIINLLFYFTIQRLSSPGPMIEWASWGFAVGAVTMPICCFLMAHNRSLRAIFLIPVLSTLGGALLTLREVLR
ncbi:MAG: hypothetical protein HZB43_07375 [candidate division Zixibacteria bacterium]|nr:hypothetical protein [candidate division Zixibacteria bacterium]